MNKETYNDEIDLAAIFLNLWDNKIKIILITAVFIIFGFLYFFYSSNKNYIAITNIKPISPFEIQKYEVYNYLAERVFVKEALVKKALPEENLPEKILPKTLSEIVTAINEQSLLNLFISKIKTEEIIEKGIIKFKLINKDDFQNEEDYKNAVKITAISIIDSMQNPKIDKNNVSLFWKFNYEISNKRNWRNFLEYLEKQANEEIRQSLIKKFNNGIEILEINLKFKLEDIKQEITNAVNDYNRQTNIRLAFLKEQAEIARELNIAKNTLGTENFQTDRTIITNIQFENSYYLKGFEMIEKELSLIKSREDIDLFIPNLSKIKKEERKILQSNKIERLKIFFSKTPINYKNNFKAAKIDYVATKYLHLQKSLLKILAISALIGFVTSFIFIFFNNIISSRK